MSLNSGAITFGSTLTLQPAASGTWTLTLPTSAGTNNQVLATDGAGTTSWATAGGGGATIPSVTNLLKGDGAGNGADAGFSNPSSGTLTAPSATSFTLNGGSSGAQITIGQGTNANITLAPPGTGRVIAPDGLVATPSLTFSDAATGWYKNTTSQWTFAIGGIQTLTLKSNSAELGSSGLRAWGQTNNSTDTVDTALGRNGAGVVEANTGTLGTLGGFIAKNVTVSSGALTLSGNQSAAAWTTSGLRIKGVAATLTDTTSSGTVAAAYSDVLGGNTIAASSATTFTNYISAYFNEPVAGTNVTLTNKFALGADSLRIGTSNQFKVNSAGLGIVSSGGELDFHNVADQTTNYERAFFRWSGNVFKFGPEKGGTGTLRDATFGDATSFFTASTGNGTTVNYGSTNLFVGGSTLALKIAATIILNITSTLLQFAGTTSSFPALKRSTTTLQFRLADDSGFADAQVRQHYIDATITGSGTTGNQTINKSAGTVRIAAAGSSVTVTSSLCGANSLVFANVRTNDTTAYIKNVVPSAGSFIITLGAAATAETEIQWWIFNQ